jgi:hypothetical protein
MKNTPFLISTILSALCLILGGAFFVRAGSNRSLKNAMVQQQTLNQQTQEEIRGLDKEAAEQNKVLNISQGMLQNRQAQLQMQKQYAERSAAINQRMSQIVVNTGYLAAKNNNEKLRDLLKKYDLKDAILTPDQLKKVEDQIKAQGGTAPAPAAGNPR